MSDFDKLTSDELRELYELKMKEETIAKYTIPNHPAADGYYRVWVKDTTKKSGRRQVTAKTIPDLKQKLYELEKGIHNAGRKTFKDIFCLCQSEKLNLQKSVTDNESTKSTIKKNKYDYAKFIEGTQIENMFVDDITKKDLEKVIIMNCQRYDLTPSRFAAMRTVISSTMGFAYEEEYIKDNPFKRLNFAKYKHLQVDSTPIKERVFNDIEIRKIHNELEQIHKKRPKQMTAWAIHLTMMVFMRIGEIPPLLREDVKENYILIHQEQIQTSSGKFIVANHTKTRQDRRFPISQKIRTLLDRIKAVNEEYYSESPFLFPSVDGTGCVTIKGIYNLFYRICQRCGIELSEDKRKGIHAFRRTGSTQMLGMFGAEIESKLMGHSPKVARKHYQTDDGLDMTEIASMMDAVNS